MAVAARSPDSSHEVRHRKKKLKLNCPLFRVLTARMWLLGKLLQGGMAPGRRQSWASKSIRIRREPEGRDEGEGENIVNNLETTQK